ncbi:hypothetical protein PtrSN002B_010677 [Pyrenophora tritici-repentis]|nr:hypothetical protein PtrV1_12639 [Pyrenophora tritici-repentis]KAF7565721.1 hypothetical protein PtrM4_051550 [Pyrenophora tritici-repentis]KAG9380169.1 hypothetical protein A1F94_009064 [Pyrenophora tritici-repentis]KAI0581691.1 hypothetical protein Alg215_04576 [Pyrenophora tritici-repentis]KAI0583758.1 hypothetical protein Alg130_05497 [Pyrenophora tritici-repentis]
MSGSLLLSLLLPLLVLAQDTTGSELPPPGYNGGSDNPQDPSDAGAAGASKGAFSLSSGALAAIIVVAVVVVLGSIASGTLWWLAKKRQWDVRASIRRASRRFTGRSTADNTSKQAHQNRQNRRTGIRLNSPPPGKNANKMRDIEKGLPLANKAPQTTTTITSKQSNSRCCATHGHLVSGDEPLGGQVQKPTDTTTDQITVSVSTCLLGAEHESSVQLLDESATTSQLELLEATKFTIYQMEEEQIDTRSCFME